MHVSMPVENSIEFINVVPLNPLISKCQIKVCYVGEEPNRNGSVITKEVATEMANSLPGCPIVGYYNEHEEDFEEHNKTIDISNGKFVITDTTVPYGFVDLGAKVWFQKFIDDGITEREYLVTEGYIWTGQFPEAKRIVEQGNNQSMELDEGTLNGAWTKDDNGNLKFFIINEAIISKLCILGENVEPCFEGSQIKAEFSFEEGFKNTWFNMIQEVKELLNKGGDQTVDIKAYSAEVGGQLWEALYSFLDENYKDEENGRSCYSLSGLYEEDSQAFAVLDKQGEKTRLDFSVNEAGEFSFNTECSDIDVSALSEIETGFSLEDVTTFEETRYAKKDEDEEEKKSDENGQDDKNDKEEYSENKKKKKTDDEEKKKTKCSLEENPEYIELMDKYTKLQKDFSALQEENIVLSEFKQNIELGKKQEMIDSFFMLSDEDKKDVVENINTYSLEEIESKLSVICVRNKVSFSCDEGKDDNTFNLKEPTYAADSWIAAVKETQKNM